MENSYQALPISTISMAVKCQNGIGLSKAIALQHVDALHMHCGQADVGAEPMYPDVHGFWDDRLDAYRCKCALVHHRNH